MADVVVDFGGRVIEPGDIVAYPVRRGSEMWLRSLRVSHIDVIRATPPVYHIAGSNDTGRMVKLENPERCVIMSKGTKNAESISV
jgi:hypothetical protein